MGRRGPMKRERAIEQFKLPGNVSRKLNKDPEYLLEYPISDPKRGLLQHCRYRCKVYEGLLRERCTAYWLHHMLFGRAPLARLITRCHKVARDLLIERDELLELEEAARDCLGSDDKPISVLEQSVVLANRSKHATPCWGPNKQRRWYVHHSEQHKNAWSRAKAWRDRERKKLADIRARTNKTSLSLIYSFYEQLLSLHKSEKLQKFTAVAWSWQNEVKLIQEELETTPKSLSSKEQTKIKKHRRALIKQRDGYLRDLQAISYNISLLGQWAVEELSRKHARFGRKKKIDEKVAEAKRRIDKDGNIKDNPTSLSSPSEVAEAAESALSDFDPDAFNEFNQVKEI